MLPSRDEAQRLMSSLQKCKVRHFKDSGHTLLLVGEMKIHTCKYGHTSAGSFSEQRLFRDADFSILAGKSEVCTVYCDSNSI